MAHDNRRSQVRNRLDPPLLVTVELIGAGDSAPAGLIGLAIDESLSGCGLVLSLAPRLQVGARLRIHFENEAAREAEVRWSQTVEEYSLRVGVQYSSPRS